MAPEPVPIEELETAALIELLRSDRWAVRSPAVQALADREGPEVRDALLGALRDDSKIVRFYAWRALAESGDAELVPVLREAAKREGPLQRRTMKKIIDRLENGDAPQPLRPRPGR